MKRAKVWHCALVIFGTAHASLAVSLVPNSYAVLPGTEVLTGVVIAQAEQPLTAIPGSLVVTSTVVREIGTGTLDFIYAVGDGSAPLISNGAVSIDIRAFAGYQTDVDFVGGLRSDIIPAAQRSSDGATITYFSDSGTGVQDFLVRTNAQAFDMSGTFRIDIGGEVLPPLSGPLTPTSDSAAVFAPAGVETGGVPEISTFAAFLIGGGLWAMRRGRRRSLAGIAN